MDSGPQPAVQPVPILLVDDRPQNLLALEGVLERPDYQLVKAASGEEALRAMLEQDFAVVLMDLFMPGLDGFQVARLMKQRPRSRETPIIFVTASGTLEQQLEQAYLAGAVDYLTKPVDPVMVRAKVAVFVDLFRKERLLRRQAEQIQEHERRERARQLAELRRASQARYRNLAESMPAMVWMADPQGRVTYWNRTWYGYTGLSPEESLGEGWTRALHPDDLPRELNGWAEAVREGRPYQSERRFRRGADGAYRWHLARATPERDERGELLGWLGADVDVDDQRQAQAERERLLQRERGARAEAEAASRLKDEFLANLSHELRTPLTPILSWTQLLRGGRLPPPQQERALDVIERSARAEARLVEDILDSSRMVSGHFRLERRPLDLAEVVRLAAEIVRPAAEARRQHLELELAPLAGGLVGDPERLRQVVWNLLSNAIKFTPEGGRIRVRLGERDGRARLEVEDSGVGIDPDFLPHLFERFRQADGGPTRRQGGLGLGLAIVRHLVELHGGTVQALSPGLGRGATFVVELPLRPADQPAPAPAPA